MRSYARVFVFPASSYTNARRSPIPPHPPTPIAARWRPLSGVSTAPEAGAGARTGARPARTSTAPEPRPARCSQSRRHTRTEADDVRIGSKPASRLRQPSDRLRPSRIPYPSGRGRSQGTRARERPIGAASRQAPRGQGLPQSLLIPRAPGQAGGRNLPRAEVLVHLQG